MREFKNARMCLLVNAKFLCTKSPHAHFSYFISYSSLHFELCIASVSEVPLMQRHSWRTFSYLLSLLNFLHRQNYIYQRSTNALHEVISWCVLITATGGGEHGNVVRHERRQWRETFNGLYRTFTGRKTGSLTLRRKEPSDGSSFYLVHQMVLCILLKCPETVGSWGAVMQSAHCSGFVCLTSSELE